MNWEAPKVYAVKHKDISTRMASRSGGIFTALSDNILEQGGIVYGCVLTDDFLAAHVRAEKAEDRNQMRGSKYIQSDLRGVFKMVRTDLDAGKKVLFSGTSCQVAGLQGFLGKEYDHLCCVDIVCHGVPSSNVWKAYIKWQERRNHSKCVNVDFRNKRDHGWAAHIETMMFASGAKVDSEVFKNLFYGHHILRPCCYQCPYKSTMHPGDITIADYWKIRKAAPGFNDNRGVSLVLLNNDDGNAAFEAVKEAVEYRACRIEDSLQTPLVRPFERPECREVFWKDFHKRSFRFVAKKYGGYVPENRIAVNVKKLKKKLKRLLKTLT
ncbi:MAG: Coenzyme F420 hydrogenase/dehydrogenase, beta subunit C-terminal domain [Oscillospiraceae bacterium]|nr:Coenzyme F420 hydrogenase/dehydrogenase, beta subunit C-terminal domain [Oscillospiraceae bacterium]